MPDERLYHIFTFMFCPCVQGAFSTCSETKLYKPVVSVANVQLERAFLFVPKKIDEVKSVDPRVCSNKDITVLALLRKIIARLN